MSLFKFPSSVIYFISVITFSLLLLLWPRKPKIVLVLANYSPPLSSIFILTYPTDNIGTLCQWISSRITDMDSNNTYSLDAADDSRIANPDYCRALSCCHSANVDRHRPELQKTSAVWPHILALHTHTRYICHVSHSVYSFVILK